MKISISYPPLESERGTPCLTQNRQFQWFSTPTYIYPVIPAYAATILKLTGHEVFWDDAIAQKLGYAEWKERIFSFRPDVIALETKTPAVKHHWKIIDEIKKEGNEAGWNPTVVLMGDHVSAFPDESLKNSKADFVIASGDYDFMLLNLLGFLEGKNDLEGGIWFRDQSGKIASSGPTELEAHDLDQLPLLDRELTKWKDYAFENGNFKRVPGAYLMSGRDCWWGKCSFCSWTTMFPGHNFRKMSPEKALAEVENLVKLGAREIMEDSGTLPIGAWLEKFCHGLIDRGLNKKITIGCNMRIGAISNPKTWELMKEAGFRFVLFGLESVNQKTLDLINKGLKAEEIEPGLRMCRNAGLEPHITVMFGYPWESKKDAWRTIKFAKKLLGKGIVETLQGTVLVPYPGTPLFDYCEKGDLLNTKNYDDFDQQSQVMKSALSSAEVKKMVRSLYFSALNPRFIFRKLLSLRSPEEWKYFWSAAKRWLGHLGDFSK